MNVKDAIEKSLGKGLDDRQLTLIANLAVNKLYMGGDTIVRQFDRSSDVYVVLAGKVRVFSAKEDFIAELPPGAIFGEVALVDDLPRSAGARSVGEATVATIPGDAFTELMNDNPVMKATIMNNIAKTLATRLRVSMIHLEGLMSVQEV